MSVGRTHKVRISAGAGSGTPIYSANFLNPKAGLPSSPSNGDRYVAEDTANGWIKDNIYEYQDGSWDETIVEEGYGAVTSKGETCWYKKDPLANVLKWVRQTDNLLSEEVRIGTDFQSRNMPQVKDKHYKKAPITHREQHSMYEESKRYYYPVCSIRDYFKMGSYTDGKRIWDWVEDMLGVTLYGVARPQFYIEGQSFALIPGGSGISMSGECKLISYTSTSRYIAELTSGTFPGVTGEGVIFGFPDNGDKPRSIVYSNNISGNIYEIGFHPQDKREGIRSWDIGTIVRFGPATGNGHSWQPIRCKGTGWVGMNNNNSNYSRKTPNAFYKSFIFPRLDDPGDYPNAITFGDISYTERSRIFVSIDVHRSHVPVLVKQKRLKDVLFYDVDGMDFPSMVIENQIGDLNYPSGKIYFNGLTNAGGLDGNGWTITGIAKVRFTDPLNMAGPGPDWYWHGHPLRGLLISFNDGLTDRGRLLNVPVGLEVVVPRGYYPLLVRDPKPFSTSNYKYTIGGSPMRAGKYKSGGGYFINPCNPNHRQGDGVMYWDNTQPPLEGQNNKIYFSYNYNRITDNWKFEKGRERFRFIAVDKKGVISENSDSFIIKKVNNLWSYGTDFPIVQRENTRS